MQTHALCALLTVMLMDTTGADRQDNGITVKKCCGVYEMLSANGKTCVRAPWPRNASIKRGRYSSIVPPLDEAWVRRWLPPGVPLRSIDTVSEKSRYKLEYVMSVNASSVWDRRRPPAEDAWSTQVVFDHHSIARPKEGDDVRRVEMYCVDAALGPLGPFALRFRARCSSDDCVTKCCEKNLMLKDRDGVWKCEVGGRASWKPSKSYLAEEISRELPFHIKLRCPLLRLATSEERSARWTRSRTTDFLFSSKEPCFDYYRVNGTRREGIFYCEYPRVARGAYWILRPLCVASSLLLAVCLLNVACDKSMRRKVHAWCLASHTACLFGFNVGQVVYYVSVSDTADGVRGYFMSHRLQNMCTLFALGMYFLLTAGWFWLTALCVNMALGFRLQASSNKSDWKRYLIFSVFAWGLSALLTMACSLLFTPPDSALLKSSRPSFNPALMEARVCYNEPYGLSSSAKNRKYFSYKYGTTLFYYGPVGCLVICNIVCLVITLRKVQRLRRGNSILRREEDLGVGGTRLEKGNYSLDVDLVDDKESPRRRGNRGGKRTAIDTKAIKIYLKLLLMSGGIELFSETVIWATTNYSNNYPYAHLDYHYPYRASGYVTDFFRAACVAWLAAPEGGFLGPIRKRLRRESKEESSTSRVT